MQAFNRRAFLKGTGTLALAAAASGLLCGVGYVFAYLKVIFAYAHGFLYLIPSLSAVSPSRARITALLSSLAIMSICTS